jgi:predicted O-methyltransferase YrrM
MTPQVESVLDRLHRQARGDWRKLPRVLPRALYGVVTGRSMMRTVTPAMLKDAYIPVTRNDGRLLHALARGTDAKRIVEFGASFGISTLYLADAVRANGGGQVITTEIEPSKCRAAEANIREAGLGDVATVLEGDALETLKHVDGPIDLLFLDGWKDLYLPVLDLVGPKLRQRAVIVADNVNFPDTKPYLQRVRNDPCFVSATLPGGRMECTWMLEWHD